MTYTPTCSTATAGVFIMGVDYDTTDSPPSSKQILSGYDGATRGSVWSKVVMQIKPMAGWYYTGLGGNSPGPAGTDAKFYDLGKLYFGVFNNLAAGNVGELSVSYTVEFSKPEFTIPSALSEKVVTTGSTLSLLAGTTPAVTGNPVFALTPNGSGSALLTAAYTGDYLLSLVGNFTSTVALPGNKVFEDMKVTSPDGPTVTVPWSEFLVSTQAINTVGIWLMVGIVSVVAGSTIELRMLSSITAAELFRFRVSSYRSSLS